MEANPEVSDPALQPLPALWSDRWNVSEVQTLSDLFPGDGPLGSDPGTGQGELVAPPLRCWNGLEREGFKS